MTKTDIYEFLGKLKRPFIIEGRMFLFFDESCKEYLETLRGDIHISLPPVSNNTRCSFFKNGNATEEKRTSRHLPKPR